MAHEARRSREANVLLGAAGGKELTLRQLRDIVSMVYASKAQHDRRCDEVQEPRETMEQHLYSFLSKRYGLKSSVEEWARAIFRAIEREAPRECDIAVFGKILQNKLAENFAAVQDTLCQTVGSLLRQSLKRRYPQRLAADIEALRRSWMRTGVPFRECESMIRHMYNEADSARALKQLHGLPSFGSSAGEGDREARLVRYRDLINVLLAFQMQLTEEFLAEFVQLFSEVDTDDDGIVSSAQLEELLERLASAEDLDGLDDEAVAALEEARLASQDAIQRYRSATFSESVELFNRMMGARIGIFGESAEEWEEEEEDLEVIEENESNVTSE